MLSIHPDAATRDDVARLASEYMALRALKCPPISDGDSCICPIEELMESINLAIGGIDALSKNWTKEAKKDILAIKQTLEAQT
jgi:hypothetical protein